MTPDIRHVLLVEDDPRDAAALLAAADDTGVPTVFHVVDCASAALAFLGRKHVFAHAPTPSAILVDLCLPLVSGHDLLSDLADDPRYSTIPRVAISRRLSAADHYLAGRQATRCVHKSENTAALQVVAKGLNELAHGRPWSD